MFKDRTLVASRWLAGCLLLIGSSLHSEMLPGGLYAQTSDQNGWRAKAETRLKGIYERNEFRAKNLQPVWLNDSSGVTIEQPDTEGKHIVRWAYDVRTGERRKWVEGDQLAVRPDGSISPDGKMELVVRDGTLRVLAREEKRETVLVTAKAGRDVQFRNLVWSPTGARIAFVEVDLTDVRQRAVIVPTDPTYPEIQQHPFARVGETIESLKVGVVNADGSELTWLPVDSPKDGCYLGQVEWVGGSEELLVEWFNRFRNQRKLFLLNSLGETRTIFSESSEAWVESSQGKNAGVVWVNDGQEFVLISEKDGWRHAYLYARSGKELACLTPGEFDIIDRAVIDEDRGWYYFYASPDNATEKYLYRVPLSGTGKRERVSPAEQQGTHHYHFSPDAKWAVHTFSTLDLPPVCQLVEIDGHRMICSLEEHRELQDKMKSIAVGPAEFLKLEIGVGVEMDAWLLKPKLFDETKRYPLLVYVYGEPHAQTVLNEWGAAQIDFHRLVAELGYVVVSIDNRGTPAPKGAAWRRAVFGSLGPLSTEEQAAGLLALAKQCPFVDLSRVGIWGWSGGGSNTLNALFRKPELYQVGIAVVPKPQPHLYNAWFQEIYMHTREVNPHGYEQSAPLNFADGLKGELLIITGSGETNTHIQIIEGLVDRLISLSKSFDYMVYPNRDHGLREGAGTLVHVRMKILHFLQNNLPAGPR